MRPHALLTGIWILAGLCVAGVAGADVAASSAPSTTPAAAPWVHTFTPLRQVYVSPDGTGTGASGLSHATSLPSTIRKYLTIGTLSITRTDLRSGA